jgi:hypothetical protein
VKRPTELQTCLPNEGKRFKLQQSRTSTNDTNFDLQKPNDLADHPHHIMTAKSISFQPVDSLEYSRIRVAGSGDCFYRCLSTVIHGNEDHHLSLRNQVCGTMCENPDAFFQYYDNNNQIEFLDHVIQQQGQGVWATQVEIFAAATLLQVPIYVYMRNERQKMWLCHNPVFPLPSNNRCNYFIAIINDSNVHYDVLLPTNSRCTCMMAPPVQHTVQHLPIDLTEK